MNEIITSENYNKAVALHKKIAANAQAAQECLYEVCKGLKEMRDDKLYKELGYQNFKDYCENEVGISDRMSRKYITIYEKWNPGSTFEKIGVAKLYLLSTLSEEERNEITEKNDIEEISKRELEDEIKKLREENKRMLEYKDSEIDSLQARLTDTGNAMRKTASEKEEIEAKLKEKEKDIISLEETIEELENRPVDVAVQESAETEELKNEIQQLTHQHELQLSDIKNEHSAEIEKIKSEYEKKLSEQPEAVTVEDTKSVFKAYLSTAIDAANRLLAFIYGML